MWSFLARSCKCPAHMLSWCPEPSLVWGPVIQSWSDRWESHKEKCVQEEEPHTERSGECLPGEWVGQWAAGSNSVRDSGFPLFWSPCSWKQPGGILPSYQFHWWMTFLCFTRWDTVSFEKIRFLASLTKILNKCLKFWQWTSGWLCCLNVSSRIGVPMEGTVLGFSSLIPTEGSRGDRCVFPVCLLEKWHLTYRMECQKEGARLQRWKPEKRYPPSLSATW